MISPMLCKPIKTPFKDPNYIIERKFDGIRAIMTVQGNGKWFIETRTGQEITHRFPEIEPKCTGDTYILDGEIVCFKGSQTDFQAMQARTQRENDITAYAIKYPATFVAFDCLMTGNIGTMHMSLSDRKVLVYPFTNDAQTIIGAAIYADKIYLPSNYTSWEGLIYKNVHSAYLEGKRTSDWLKYKFTKRERVWVVGFTHGTGKRQGYFGALIVARLVDGEFKFAGCVGTGYTDLDLEYIRDNFNYSTIDFDRDFMCRTTAHVMVRPFEIEVEYLELTKAGIMRQPAFKEYVQ